MRIYISGISGTGMGPLAIMAKEAGLEVVGSDLSRGAISDELDKNGIEFMVGKQDGRFLEEQFSREGGASAGRDGSGEGGVDWFVYTSALPKDHPELKLAQKLGIKCSKRDELIAFLVEKLKLKMVAVAGTHGKTTTTSMIIWGALRFGLPISYLTGTTLGFAGAGKYEPGSKFLIYEADEYDRNFLHFHPWLAIITTVSYDHPDIYPTVEDYRAAFRQFEKQSGEVIYGDSSFSSSAEADGSEASVGADGSAISATAVSAGEFKLAGEARRMDAAMAFGAILRMAKEVGVEIEHEKLKQVLDDFPGAGRRFEKIAEGVYSDYGHHPEEIAATVEMAREEAELKGFKGVVAIYEPHQNVRQHEVFDGYRKAFLGVEKLYWLPTFLTRENPELRVIPPEEFIESLDNSEVGEAAEMDAATTAKLRKWQEKGFLILLMSAGPADGWIREGFGSSASETGSESSGFGADFSKGSSGLGVDFSKESSGLEKGK